MSKVLASDTERFTNEIQIRPALWNFNLPNDFRKCNVLYFYSDIALDRCIMRIRLLRVDLVLVAINFN